MMQFGPYAYEIQGVNHKEKYILYILHIMQTVADASVPIAVMNNPWMLRLQQGFDVPLGVRNCAMCCGPSHDGFRRCVTVKA